MDEELPDERIDPLALFPPEMREGVQDLAYLGYLTRQVDFCGHTFALETIRPYVKYVISQVLEPWRNTIKEPEIYAAVHVAMALGSVDGNPDFCPPVNDSLRSYVEARLNWLSGPNGYWQPTIDYLFAQYVEMEQEVAAAIGKLHSLAERSRDTSQPSPASWTVPGPSIAETSGDTQPTDPSS